MRLKIKGYPNYTIDKNGTILNKNSLALRYQYRTVRGYYIKKL